MLNLETRLSRRDLLKGIGIVGANILADRLFGQMANPIAGDLIIFTQTEDSQANDLIPSQSSIDYLVQQEFGNDANIFVNNFNYDSDRSKAKEELTQFYDKLVDDPIFMKIALNFLKHPQLTEIINSNQGTQAILLDENSIMEFKQFIISSFRLRMNDDLKHSLAVTNQYSMDFGTGKKSDVFIFDSVFKELPIFETENGVINLTRENYIRIILRHEHYHAKILSEGIKLTDDLYLNSSNYSSVLPQVQSLVEEMEAYIGVYQHYKQNGKGNPQLIEAADMMRKAYYFYDNKLQGGKYTAFENKLIGFQLSRVEKLMPELNSLLDGIRIKINYIK